ncbi:evolutionarily conserved signaling intermediate in Toll pathway, mitochondrial [Meriones unguiculatus]|uniref:evolutionarily conserved signaling intermediate in Toll pathway, mitochondrial n=1 Tax=Meriones unguiculatus TaxID=10047 RepID=UPI000B4FB935|nr:evolutionarily conserved signaling intermediate in Toll pathway, mitochondrial [Meriones unguiculatus]XP_021499513.1 evolutionarily conserved signaling intermediate in Toll pathway, mitochondrial [Meriones unguiculatus]XP_021499514.1 evolutionarily conserved signaling intermediate in Toll pathway, mitochondrial isoform X1 [Meriones unguiculatus]XP_021499515.1 evolutionarily conserved signaling intermediate in Toll pathway, mitochondrial [Meriones unguiculatus]
MSWVHASLLARGLSRGWGSICRTALSGGPFAQLSLQAPRGLHCSAVAHKDEAWLVPRAPDPQRKPVKVPAMHEGLFRPSGNREQDKASFLRAVQSFGEHSVHKRGHVDFIYLALRKMPEFGVERDLSVYNLLLDIFPKEVFQPRNIFQRIFIHYPRQQECGVAVLEQMERYGIMPNTETEFLLIQIFGRQSHPMLKFLRMKLWFTRFKNINPYPVPQDLPQDPLDLAKLGLRHMEPDLSAKITVYQMSQPSDSTGLEDPPQPHIVGIQSPDQQAALARHNPSRPVFVEGPFPLWLRNKCVYYHILRADLPPPEEEKVEETPEEWNLYYPMKLDLDYSRAGWDDYEFDVDEVTEGPIFAICMAGAHDQATLVKWIQALQETNPILAQIPVVFRLARSTGELVTTSRMEGQSPPHVPPKGQEEDETLQAQQQQGQS